MGAELTDRVALVTGAAGGIGSAIARALAGSGAIVVAADVDRAGAERVAGGLTEAISREADVSDPRSCVGLVQSVLGDLGRLDVVVNNAGLQYVAPIQEMPLDRWHQLIATMLTGPFVLVREALPSMYERGWGRIVNVGSVHSLVASPNKSAYVSAKHGLLGLTRAIAVEAGPHGVTANLVCPAYVRTALVDRQIADQARTLGIPVEEVVDRVMLEPASIRRLIDPDEVADYVGYLCSDAASMITGSAQVIDGGWTAR